MTHDIHIVGGGLAVRKPRGSLPSRFQGTPVRNARIGREDPGPPDRGLAELVCSNSFRSDDAEANAVGLLHQEMRTLGSLILTQADRHRVPAGSALAVDRDGYSQA